MLECKFSMKSSFMLFKSLLFIFFSNKTFFFLFFILSLHLFRGDYSADKILRTERESRPDRPKFHNIVKDPNFSDIVSQYANQFHTTWIIPPDNGRRIEYFEIKYYEVSSFFLLVSKFLPLFIHSSLFFKYYFPFIIFFFK